MPRHAAAGAAACGGARSPSPVFPAPPIVCWLGRPSAHTAAELKPRRTSPVTLPFFLFLRRYRGPAPGHHPPTLACLSLLHRSNTPPAAPTPTTLFARHVCLSPPSRYPCCVQIRKTRHHHCRAPAAAVPELRRRIPSCCAVYLLMCVPLYPPTTARLAVHPPTRRLPVLSDRLPLACPALPFVDTAAQTNLALRTPFPRRPCIWLCCICYFFCCLVCGAFVPAQPCLPRRV